MLAATCVSTCFFLLYDGSMSPLENTITMFVYVCTDIALLSFCIIAVIAAFFRITKLKIGKPHNQFNQNLIFVSLVGYYSLLVFAAVPTITAAFGSDNLQLFPLFEVIIIILSFAQSTAQVAFIVDGLRRSATERQHLRSKPGRSLVTFLIISNLAMWIVNSFQVKEIHSHAIWRKFYGDLAWQSMVHLCLPMTIFFRFHSSVCLSDIWLNAYRRETKTRRLTKTFNSENLL